MTYEKQMIEHKRKSIRLKTCLPANRWRSRRLQAGDYSFSAYYFVTICSQNREPIFDDINEGKMDPNDIGKTINRWWVKLPNKFDINLDEFQLMPNHFHGIIKIKNQIGFDESNPYSTNNMFEIGKSHKHMQLMGLGVIHHAQTETLGIIIRYFKAKCSHEIHKSGFNQIVWQRNYPPASALSASDWRAGYEHIVRNEIELEKIREYINLNPLKWHLDKNNPINARRGLIHQTQNNHAQIKQNKTWQQ